MPAAPPAPTARPTLTRQRCWNHPEREAAVRCPSCGRFYCRECVTEHAGRMVCAVCLRARFAADGARVGAGGGAGLRVLRAAGTGAWRVAQAAGGIALAWFFFHLAAQKLAALPEKFHEGTFWKDQVIKDTDE